MRTTTTTTSSCSLDHRPAAASIQKIHRCRSRWKRSSVTAHSSAVTSGELGHMKYPQDLYIVPGAVLLLSSHADQFSYFLVLLCSFFCCFQICDSFAAAALESYDFDRARVHPKFLHSNATSHKWAFGGISPYC